MGVVQLTGNMLYEIARRVPDVPVVDRNSWLVGRCYGKTILSLGCTGKTQAMLDEVCPTVYGVDIEPLERENFTVLNLDECPKSLPECDVDLVVAAEVIEHLRNPGKLLDAIASKYPNVPLIVTTPNAFADIGRESLCNGIERVNLQHVAYYSYKTLERCLSMSGYEIVQWFWYKPGPPVFAEGLIMEANKQKEEC